MAGSSERSNISFLVDFYLHRTHEKSDILRLLNLQRTRFLPGLAADGASDYRKREQKNPTPDNEFVTELLYLEMVARLSHLKMHFIASNQIVEMGKYVDVVMKNGPIANDEGVARQIAQNHQEGLGHDRAQFLMLEELYRFITFVMQEFPDQQEDFMPFQIGLLKLIETLEAQREHDNFTWIYRLRRAETVEEKEQMHEKYLQVIAGSPSVSGEEKAAVAKLAGKDQSKKTKIESMIHAVAQTLRSGQKAVVKMFGRRYDLSAVKKITTLGFFADVSDASMRIPIPASDLVSSQSHE